MIDYLYPIAALIALAGLIYKVIELRRDPRNPALQSICGLLNFLGLSVGLGSPAVLAHIDAIVGVTGVGGILARSSAILAAVCAQALVLHLENPSRRAARRITVRWLVAAATLLTMGIAFWINRTGAPSNDEHLTGTASGAVYICAYLAYLAFADIDILRLSLRYVKTAARPLLRFGIRMLSTASLGDLVYVGHEAGSFIVNSLGRHPQTSDAVWNTLLMLGTVLALTGGVVLPSVGPLIADAAQWPGRWRLYRRLHPLWLAVYRALPHIALEPPADPERDRLVGRDLYRALYRRVIEIHDALVELGPFAGDVGRIAQDHALRSGSTSQTASAVADATTIAIGIRELEGAHPTVAAANVVVARDRADDVDSANLSDAARRLVRVADALQRSSVVSAMVAEYAYGTRFKTPASPSGHEPQ